MGILESSLLARRIIREKIISVIKIFFLKLRGFSIDYSVKLHSRTSFFQEIKHSIRIGQNSVIGSGIRMRAFLGGKIDISEDVAIDDYSYIISGQSVKIGKGTLIAAAVYISDCDHKLPLAKFRDNPTAPESLVGSPVVIGEHVWIGTHAVILKGVEIGDNSIIGAGSIVTKSVPPNSIAVGNPAKVIKKL